MQAIFLYCENNFMLLVRICHLASNFFHFERVNIFSLSLSSSLWGNCGEGGEEEEVFISIVALWAFNVQNLTQMFIPMLNHV